MAQDGANKRAFTFQLPADPEGGLVTVEVTGKQLFAGIRVAGSEGTFVGASTSQGPTARMAFVGEPGVSYEIELEETSVTATEQSQPVSFSWALKSVVDCYEPNDTPQQARPIPLGAEIETHLFAGFVSNDWPSYEAHHDFFELNVDRPGLLRVTLQPGPVSIALELFSASSPEQPLNGAHTLDAPVTIENEVSPGRYLARFSPFVSLSYTPQPDDCAQCNTYRFTTELIHADGSGKADQRCQGDGGQGGASGQGGSAGQSGVGGLAGSSGTAGTGGIQGCGWNPEAGYYECGFSGPDPSFQAPIACPLGLNEGDPCGKITGTGCCDDEGGIWYCSDQQGQLSLVRDLCLGGQGGTSGQGGSAGQSGSAGAAGAPVKGCGWNPEAGYYECGFSGPDPSFQAPIACPLGLNEGDPCGKITGTGCCDDEGGVWYCSDADGQEALAREVCVGGQGGTSGQGGTPGQGGSAGAAGAPVQSCGWYPEAGYYECGFSGPDPSGTFPIACPSGLVEGNPCGEISGTGCCDDEGGVWYCSDSNNELSLVRVSCLSEQGGASGQGGTSGQGGSAGQSGSAGAAGAPVKGCGWNPEAGYYECGFSGPDPSFQAPIACPLGLNEGDPCGKITGTGCCDDEGGVWYCSDADGQEALAREVCIP